MQPYNMDEAEAELRAAIDADDVEAIKRLEPIIDALDVKPDKASLHAAALWYAAEGLRVFPLTPGTKIPLKGSGGCKDATSDAARIDAWWKGNPKLNIGIATGHLVDVIDVDGYDGVVSVTRAVSQLPTVIGKVSTPRPGGNHYYVAAVPGRGNKAGILPSVDYRGTGGYVVAPPSVITGNGPGEHPGTYTWYQPLDLSGLNASVGSVAV